MSQDKNVADLQEAEVVFRVKMTDKINLPDDIACEVSYEQKAIAPQPLKDEADAVLDGLNLLNDITIPDGPVRIYFWCSGCGKAYGNGYVLTKLCCKKAWTSRACRECGGRRSVTGKPCQACDGTGRLS